MIPRTLLYPAYPSVLSRYRIITDYSDKKVIPIFKSKALVTHNASDLNIGISFYDRP